ncbi:peptide/nickel transport system ATP-binding protein [Desulfonispora thiosulfatigenes DSM 11270]|uniref:Peptide/nickel transport system ATP-binding protein n=1 Tax=Desulfonispora thiosulfatigenes DSM 11270 TaxID=656914 RepID=A0A1W1V874_DESTI|nr:ABC transporter ATP-binding protein [Desulfonispora thiosulfatigenes]SMB89677.1 peptide/nickel transport system ATP-binding protein [Desulfonispora thiosulfatigenes DSM 11270]
MEKVLDVNKLSIDFPTPHGIYKAVRNLSFSLYEGEILAIVGESGSGKSVTAKSLLGLIEAPGILKDGIVMINGQNIFSLTSEERCTIRGKRIGMIFQDPNIAFDPVCTIGKQMVETLLNHNLVKNFNEGKNISLEWLEYVGFLDPLRVFNSYSFELSGGMRQRAYIAMVMVLEPQILIADEPTTALDMVNQARVLNLLKKMKQEKNCSIILITHDLSIVANTADRILVMYAGEALEYGEMIDVLYDPSHPYTKALIRSVNMGEKNLKLNVIKGEPPRMNEKISGCSFAKRCEFAGDECLENKPKLTLGSKGKYVRCLKFPKRLGDKL